jgi:histidyl-tRNA synthetase
VLAFIEPAWHPIRSRETVLLRDVSEAKSQKGRYRQFNQFGVEALGSAFSAMDAE